MRRTIAEIILAVALCFSPALAHAAGFLVSGHFAQAKSVNRWCGRATSSEWRGTHGVYHQNFQHCRMAEAPVQVMRWPPPTATPRPTATPWPTATPAPTATPLPPTPIGCSDAANDCSAYVVDLINHERAQRGVAPLTMDTTQNGCSLQHSIHMQAVGTISHDQFPADVCIPYALAGENVGEAGGSAQAGSLTIHNLMMAEGTSNCAAVVSHACNIINPNFSRVGVGVYAANGSVWLTEDFTG